MSFFHKGQGDQRAPEAEVLPDGRKRLTCYKLTASIANLATELVAEYGTVHPADSEAPTGWTGLRLVNRRVTDDPMPAGRDTRPVRVLVYEQIPESTEIQVGANTLTALEDGRTALEAEFLQFVAGAYVPGTVGTTTAAGDASAFLQKAEQTNDGTLRRIKRTYVYAGIIATDDESLQGGALLKKTIVSVKTVPSTPSGYTLVGSPVQSPLGLPVYTYTYYKGSGEVSRRYRVDKLGENAFDPTANPVTYACGAVVETIEYLTAQSVTANPTTTHLGGGVLFSMAKEDRDGYRFWTVDYGEGKGQVDFSTQTRNGGKLILYRAVGFGTPPSTPGATIGGTVLATGQQSTGADGYTIYDYSWAEGVGEISRRFTNAQGGATDFDPTAPTASKGPVRCTITFLTATSVTTDPTTPPANFKRVSIDHEDADGHRVWTVEFGFGAGIVVDTYEEHHEGKLYNYRQIELSQNSAYAPATPAARISPLSPAALTTFATGFSQPVCHVFDSTGNLFVANVGTGDINKITPAGVKTVFDSGYNQPNGITIDADDNLYVSEFGTDDIYFITPAGAASYVFSGVGGSTGMAMGADGNIYLCNYSANTVSKITPLGVITSYATGFTNPIACAFDSAGNLFVVNWGSTIVQKVAVGGAVSTFATGITQGTDIAIDSDGVLYVANWGAGISKITNPGAVVSLFLGGVGQVSGVALDAEENLYIGTSTGQLICRIGTRAPSSVVTLTSQTKRLAEGWFVFESEWVEGFGVISRRRETREGGLQLETWVSLGAAFSAVFMQPDGVLMLKEEQPLDGVTQFVVTCMQGADGGDPAASSYSTEAWVPFRYPGQAKYFSQDATAPGSITIHCKDVYLSPPVDNLVLATTTITYQTSDAVGSLAHTLWNPAQWATLIARFVEGSGFPRSIVRGLEGYTAVNSGSSGTSSSGFAGSDTACMGELVYQGGTWAIVLSGGPTLPDGATAYTLHAEVEKEPAFVGYDGTKYHRLIVVTATPAALSSLPV